MTKSEFLYAVGKIDDSIIEKSEYYHRKTFRKKAALLLAAVLIIAFSVTAGAFGFLNNRINGISVTKEFPDKNMNIEEFVFSFDIEIAEDAKEYITDYYLPMLLAESEKGYNASANSFSGRLYWEDSSEGEFIAYSQHAAIGFDYSISFGEKVNIKESKFELDGVKIHCHEIYSAENEKPLYKMYHWSDGYYIFEIMCGFETENDFIAEVIKSLEKVGDFSEYGKIRLGPYYGE